MNIRQIDQTSVENAIKHLQRTPGKPHQTIRPLSKNSGMSECFLRSLLKQGLLPGFYVGNRFYVDVPRFEAYLDALANGGKGNDNH